MTAAVLYPAMIAITANHVTAIIVRSAAHIARSAIPHCVWGVHTNVPHVMSQSVRAVLPNVRSVRRRCVKIV